MSDASTPPSDPGAFFAIAYRTHDFCNPLSAPLLDRALGFADLNRGDRAIDLGCGNAAMAIHLAQRHELQVDAVERSPAMLALARARIEAARCEGVALHHASADAFLQGVSPADLIVVTGAVQVVAGAGDQGQVFSALRSRLKPGGRLLYGDPFWKRPPSERLGFLLPGYDTHAAYVRAGEAAGYQAMFAGESPQADWDDYAWRMANSAEAHAREHPEDTRAETAQAQARFMRDLYLYEGRDSLGFGLYLFRAP